MKKQLLTILTGGFARILLLSASCFPAFAQTSPAAQPLPFSYSDIAGGTLPAGVAVHRFGTSAAAIPTTRTLIPANGDLSYSIGSVNAGGWQNSGAAGELGIGMLASGSQSAGAVLISLNTTGKTGIIAQWTARTILQQDSRDNSLALQYRLGDSGDFTDLGDASHVYTSAAKAAGDNARFSLSLPQTLEGRELVQLRWVYWESAGTSGSRDRIALDDVLIEEGVIGPDVTAPVVSTLSPADNAVNVQTTAALNITFSESVVKKAGSVTLTNTDDNSTQNIDIQSANVVVNGSVVSISGVALVNAAAYSVTMTAGALSDLAGNDFAGITNAGDWTFTTIAPPGTVTKISAIQGGGQLAALTGVHTIEGIVTRTFPGAGGLNGFYIQEEDSDSDADPLTSEAIFVYNISADPVGVVSPVQGDKVRLTGDVVDFIATTSGVTTRLTEIKTISTYENLGASALPTVVQVKLPVANVSDLERYEGMLLDVSGTSGNLTVTEYFELGRYGQVLLSVTGPGDQAGTDARLDQFTQFNAPSVSGYTDHLVQIANRQIILDDGSTRQNPDPIIFGRGGNALTASNTLRGGDQVANIVGILDERLDGYRIQSATGVNFLPANPRPAGIPDLSSSLGSPTLKVASANVLNYFVNLDVSGDQYRGANTAAEFERQKIKIVKSLIRSEADVIGLMEIQSNGSTPTAALQDLVDGLNADPEGSGTYAFIDPATTGSAIATDVIMVGILYKTDKVTPLGNAATLTTSAAFNSVGRMPLAQSFTQISNDEVFSVVVNHFKSKGSSSNGAGDANAGDGQGFSNGTRSRQATDLANWLDTNPTGAADPDYLILGDLNAYAKEEPIVILEEAGFRNLLPATSYSYVFDGQIGSLDHALANTSLARQVTGAAKWHINADEPSVLDYNTDFKSANLISSLYSPDQYRAADHDPVLIGLALDKALPVTYLTFTGIASGDKVILRWETTEELNNAGFEILKSSNGRDFRSIGNIAGNATTNQQNKYVFEDFEIEPGKTYYYQLMQKDFDGTEELSRIIAVKAASIQSGYALYPNPGTGQFTLSGKNVDKVSVRMFTILGAPVKVDVADTESSSAILVTPKSHLTPGLYYVNFTSISGVKEALKLVIK